MRRNKIKFVILIAIIILISITCAIVAFLLLGTDILKSNKEKFVKYALSFTDEDNTYDILKKYYEKQKNTPFESNGSYQTMISDENDTILNEEQRELLNKTTIKFNGKVDLANSLAEEKMSIGYVDENNNPAEIPVNLKMTELLLGVQSDFVGSKYIAIENKLKEYINTETKNSEDIEFDNIDQKIEELISIINKNSNKYLSAIMNVLSDDKFEKTKDINTGSEGYKLTINGQDIKNIVVALLDTLKNDNEVINKINEIIENNQDKITQEKIQQYITKIENDEYSDSGTGLSEFGKKDLAITVYNNGNNKEISLEFDNYSWTFEEVCNNDEITYVILYKTNEYDVNFTAKFKNLQNLNNINENYNLQIVIASEDIKITEGHLLSRNVKFVDSVNIDSFDDDNHINLDKMEEEPKQNFLKILSERITEINKLYMGKVKSDEPIIIYEIPFTATLNRLIFSGATDIIDKTTENVENRNQRYEEEMSSLQDMAIKTFNSRFEQYEGDRVQGTNVNALIQMVKQNNELEGNEKVKITADVNNWDYNNNRADANSYYKVIMEKNNESGYINAIKLEDAN